MSKPSISPGDRVAGAEQQRVGRDAGDEPAAFLDRVHVAAGRHRGRVPAGGRGAYDCRQLAVATSVPDGPATASVACARRRRRRRRRRDRGVGSYAPAVVQAPAARWRPARRGRRARAAGGGSSVLLQPLETPHQAHRAATTPASSPSTPARQPAAGVVQLVRGLLAQRRQLLVGGGVEGGEGGVARVRRRAGGQLDRTLPVTAVVEGADLLVDRGVGGPRQRVAAGGCRAGLELGELGRRPPRPRPARPSRTPRPSRGR